MMAEPPVAGVTSDGLLLTEAGQALAEEPVYQALSTYKENFWHLLYCVAQELQEKKSKEIFEEILGKSEVS